MIDDIGDIAQLDASALDRTRLHVFVAGPGEGEGVLIALPGSGWIAIDGCAVDGVPVLSELLTLWKQPNTDPLLCAVLTHPHDDHAAGIPVLLEAHEPSKIAVTAESPTGPSVIDRAKVLAELAKSSSSEEPIRSRTQSALLAIARRHERLVNALDGVPLHEDAERNLAVHTRAPHACSHLSNVLSELARGKRSHANEASLVLEVVFGATRIVLGGDLPKKRTGGSVVATGWDSVVQRHGQLAEHHGLKVPHHASAHALHVGLLSSKSTERTWWITPYDKSRLPRVHDANGLPAWLKHESSVCLTTLHRSIEAPPGTWDHARHQLTRRPPPSSDPFLGDAVDTSVSRHASFKDPIWGAAFDDQGKVVRLWRGASAVRVRS